MKQSALYGNTPANMAAVASSSPVLSGVNQDKPVVFQALEYIHMGGELHDRRTKYHMNTPFWKGFQSETQ